MTTTQNLVLELCKFRHPNEKKIEKLLLDNPDLTTVLGHLLQNRVAGVAYETLRKIDALKITDPVFERTLRKVHTEYRQRTKAYKNALRRVDEILANCRGSYAMLKGAYLCGVYPEGLRTSNDIDLLIEKKNLSKIENALKKAGLKQGSVKNGEFVPATRKEIIFASMMKGETMPYVLETDEPAMPYLEIDLNFALGYKNEAPTRVHTMLSRVVRRDFGDFAIETLCKEDFLIHLCAHLYKEATAYPWVQMGRDLSLYKFLDIYLLTEEYGKPAFDRLANRMQEAGCEKECWYALTYTQALFNIQNPALDQFLADNAPDDPDLLHKVDRPELKTVLIYTERDPIARFFAIDRKALLTEVRV